LENIIEKMQKVGFNRIEAIVYYELLKNPSSNGSKIAKLINYPRTSVYTALENLYKKGIIFLNQGKTNEYIAKNPKLLFNELKKEIYNDIDILSQELSNIAKKKEENQYINIIGFYNVVSKVKELIIETQNEIYINTNIDLKYFEEELIEANNRGVRIIMFAFDKQDTKNINVEQYNKNMNFSVNKNTYTRIMIVCDSEKVVMGSGENDENFLGTFSFNELLVDVVSEHIHNDIYITELEKKYGKNILESVKLNTKKENICNKRRDKNGI